MRNSIYFLVILLCSCSTQEKINLSENVLNEYLQIHAEKKLDEVIACAGNDKENKEKVFVYFYPIEGSSDFRYYETENTAVDPDDFSNYRLKEFPSEGFLKDKLSRFIRDLDNEAWGIVTYLSEGKIHKSNPIRLKQKSNPTELDSNVMIDFSTSLSPRFSWNVSSYNSDAIYFQAITDNESFISGTYTFDLFFRYYNTNNVVLTINSDTPLTLVENKEYGITILGVSEDNWVNIQYENQFIAK